MTDQNQPAVAGTENACPPHLARKVRLTPPDAAEYLHATHGVRVAVATLAKWRTLGGGPMFLKFNRAVIYDRAALDAWATERLGQPMASTSATSARG